MELTATERTEDLVRGWLAEIPALFGPDAWDFGTFCRKAVSAAALVRALGVAYLNVEPGNYTSYKLILTMLPDAAQRDLGGDLLVSLTNFGSCFTINSGHVEHYPDYVAEKTRLGPSDAIVLAALLTLTSLCLADAAAESAT